MLVPNDTAATPDPAPAVVFSVLIRVQVLAVRETSTPPAEFLKLVPVASKKAMPMLMLCAAVVQKTHADIEYATAAVTVADIAN